MSRQHGDAVQFCALFHLKQITLTAITLEVKPQIYTKTFRPEQKTQIEKFLSLHEGSNFYFSVNPTKTFVDKKANKKDIASMDWLHVDIDLDYEKDKAGKHIHLTDEARQIQLDAMLKKAEEFVLPPSLIIFSGGGYQLLWRLEKPIPIKDKEHWEELELFNRQLIILLKGDPPCFNIDRIMRLPGTTNYPTKIKLEKGRVPIEAKLIKATDNNYTLREFTKAPPQDRSPHNKSTTVTLKTGNLPTVNLESLNVRKEVKELILNGFIESNPNKYSSRSEAVFYVACECTRKRISTEMIAAILLNKDFAFHTLFNYKKVFIGLCQVRMDSKF